MPSKRLSQRFKPKNSGARSLLLRPLVQAGLFLLALSSSPHAANLSDLVRQSRAILGDSPYYTSVPKLTDSKIVAYLNEGQDYAATFSWAFVKRTTYSLTVGTTEYVLPPDFQTARRVTFEDGALVETMLDSLDGTDGATWIRSAGRPQKYYVRTTTYTVIGFWPIPGSVSSTGTVVLDYVASVQTMVESNDVPFNGVPEYFSLHNALPKFVAYRYYLLSGNFEAAKVFAGDFAADVKRLTDIRDLKPNYRPGFE